MDGLHHLLQMWAHSLPRSAFSLSGTRNSRGRTSARVVMGQVSGTGGPALPGPPGA